MPGQGPLMSGRRRSPPGLAALTGAVMLGACATTASPRDPLVVADISMSIAELEAIRQADPGQLEVELVLGERYRQLGQLDEAETTFRRVLDGAEGAPDLEAGALSGLGLVAQARDELALAETQLLDALQIAEAAGLHSLAREQRQRLAVVERVRGDFAAACDWHRQAGEPAAALTSTLSCDSPEQVLALAASIWRANAAPTMEGLAVEAMTTARLAAAAEAAAASGTIERQALAQTLGDYSTLVLYTDDAEAAEAVARRAIALDPRDGLLQLHLIAPLILQDRIAEADAAVDALIAAWTNLSSSGRSPSARFTAELLELWEAGLAKPHMIEVDRRLRERAGALAWGR